jgi:DNA-binding NtrC family response regulator
MWPRAQHHHEAAASSILAVLSSAADRELVTTLSRDNGWSLALTMTPQEGLAKLAERQVAVVIVDRDLAESDWRTMVRSFTWQHPPPCVILASPVSDHYLFEEVIHQGGYDVVSKPLKLEEMRRIARLAFTFWKSRLPQAHAGL